ncbi:Ribosomal protein L5 [Cinnamomum micranthum f. kanehirae]|uniref:Ribosomal protein L5 n=1 Tax=Cinnamomum micranthum f. kanehirae TaxID=337451 RepID=A0A443PAM9_9MAGN|nr:Ribosomal protein L5 [Cinnamomum micranthum f. kanehirae]
MASVTFLPSTSSSFSSLSFRSRLSAPIPIRIADHRTPKNVTGLQVKASTGPVLVEKSESEKVNRMKSVYVEKIIPLLMEEFSYTNIHQVPQVKKIVLNCGMGDASQNSKGLEAAIKNMSLISGQRPVKTKARQAIASFKLREGQTVGIMVTLRGKVRFSLLV